MPPSGLIGWWKFLEGVGIAAFDSSGNSLNGSLEGPPNWITDGPNGGGLFFHGGGTQDRVDVPRSLILEPTAITGCCWFKVTPLNNNANQALISKAILNNSAPLFGSYQLGIKPNGVEGGILCFIGGTSSILFANGVAPNDTWIFGSFTYDPAGLAPQQNLYANAVLVASRTETTPISYDTTSTGDFLIGASGNPDVSPADPGFFYGSITDVQLYNRALTAAEILTIYQGTTPVSSGGAILRGPHRGSRVTPPYNP